MANFNFNKVILGGKVTADVEQKVTPNGIAVATFTIAVNRRVGQEQKADFINCVAWRQTAEFIAKYFKKGSSICVVGSIQTRSWKDNNGNNRYATEVVCDEAMFVDSKSEGGNQNATQPNFGTPMATPNFENISTDEDWPF